ncbi:DNA polymerase III subunit beta [Peptoniphilus equinus]|uniref:Beta sliding clamp n=1 Tax=Peptoniphilus equinus TaxID=3016343 RepID=A0ABY7QT62_9FIRM|nr:DNA polymerase III subunit beta [Peptoniphilus equinus]WBW49987.1 DNA polymerase III subunit beta [Peptoniphilus equinus]
MKLKINRSEFAKAVAIAQRAISSRSTIQILEGFCLKAADNIVTLIASDTEITIKTQLSAIVDEGGDIVVNARLFGDIIRKFQGDTIDLSVNGTTMLLKCEQSTFTLQCQSTDEFPLLPSFEIDHDFTLEGHTLKEAIRKTSFAVSLDETRPVFTGVFMDLKNDGIHFVALDGFRMAFKTVDVTTEDGSAIIPARSLNELLKILGDEQVRVQLSKNMAMFSTDTTVLYTTLLSGDFFNYEALITKEYATEVEVDHRSFQASLERASLLAKEDRANLVKIEVSSDQLKISSNSEIGNVEELVPCTTIGKPVRIAFNSKYLLDGIKILESESLKLHLTDSVNPCIIREDDLSYLYLVLPVRLAEQG